MSSIRAGSWILPLAAVATLAAVLVWARHSDEQPGSPAVLPGSTARAQPSLPVIADSPYLNTCTGAEYLGSQACARCHPDTHQSYHETMMSQSMAEVDVGREPPDAEFRHARSGRRYKIYREGSELRQREILTGLEGGNEVVLADFPVKYVVGSGHFSRTYLSEIDDFLVEAPATWFAAKQGWDVSPGYDQSFPDGFERAATENCLYCHAGRIEAREGALHKIRIHEAAIGCERCHGPGSLHVQRWETESQAAGNSSQLERTAAVDLTIVNPARLPRDLAQAVCQQCHLTSGAQVTARGRKISDFRPGLPLQDYFVSYRIKGDEQSMKVVGHFDQLAQSACYRQSDTLTCLTCHNPHDKPLPDERAAYFRSICLSCHQTDDCRVDHDTTSRNDCAACHMPGVPTEIVHLAFTHHRIGIHRPGAAASHGDEPAHAELEPWNDLSRLDDLDRTRSLGLAYYDRAFDPGPHATFCFDQARNLLEEVRGRGLREGSVAGALAQILAQASDPAAVELAAEALADAEVPAAPRIRALLIVATDHYQHRQYADAIEVVHELTQLRRCSSDWALLGYCRMAAGDPQAAASAFETALDINPRLLPVHRELVQLYQAAGQSERAAQRRRIGERLRQISAQSGQRRP